MALSLNTADKAHDLTIGARNIPDSFRFGAFFVFCAIACTLAVMKPILGVGIFAGLIGMCIVLYLLFAALNGRTEPAILLWALIFPLGYYFLSFPREKSIITLDRALPLVLLLAMAFASPTKKVRLPQGIRNCGLFWFAYLLVAGASSVWGGSLLQSGRMFVEGLCLPAIIAWCVIRQFDVRQNLVALHIVVSLMSVYTMSIGLAEEVLKRDLFPLPGSTIYFADSFARPNGPLWSADSFAMVGVVTLFLLLFLRAAMGQQLPSWHKWLHGVGVVASLGMALMPMFRAVAIGLMAVLLLETLYTRKVSRKIAGFTIIGICATAVLMTVMLGPETLEDRSRPDNVYSRIAQQRQTLRVILDHPYWGVGLGQFTSSVQGDTRHLAFYKGIEAPNSPHNNLGQVAAETGLIGLLAYVLTQILLVKAMLAARKLGSRDGEVLWKYFLYVFVCYWINGMSSSSGFDGIVNIWYLFAIAVFYKYFITESVAEHPLKTERSTQREYNFVSV